MPEPPPLYAVRFHQLDLLRPGNDDRGIGNEVEFRVALLVVDRIEDDPHRVEARKVLVAGADDRRLRGVGALQHLVLAVGECLPRILGLNVDLGQLPLTQRIIAASLEPPLLLHVALQVPLAALLVGRLAESNHPVVLIVHVAGDPADRATSARSITPLEDHSASQLSRTHCVVIDRRRHRPARRHRDDPASRRGPGDRRTNRPIGVPRCRECQRPAHRGSVDPAHAGPRKDRLDAAQHAGVSGRSPELRLAVAGWGSDVSGDARTPGHHPTQRLIASRRGGVQVPAAGDLCVRGAQFSEQAIVGIAPDR